MDIFGGNSRTTMFAAVSPSLFNFSGVQGVRGSGIDTIIFDGYTNNL